MDMRKLKLGLTLPNQGVVFGATTVGELIELAENADQTGVFDAVFVGDNLLAKPRLESVTTLSALAVRTKKVRLGTACMASFPLRDPILLAAQWGVLDRLSDGRSLLVACIGGGESAKVLEEFQNEYRAFGVGRSQRVTRLEEGIEVIRALWTQERATYQGSVYKFENIAVRPPPVQKPAPPIWIANNPHAGIKNKGTQARMVERVARLADGWMTSRASPQEFRQGWAAVCQAARDRGRDPAALESCLYYTVNVGDDTPRAFAEGKKFLDEYYSTDLSPEDVRVWGSFGSAQACADQLKEFAAAGAQLITVRFASYDQMTQLKRFVEQVAPLL